MHQGKKVSERKGRVTSPTVASGGAHWYYKRMLARGQKCIGSRGGERGKERKSPHSLPSPFSFSPFFINFFKHNTIFRCSRWCDMRNFVNFCPELYEDAVWEKWCGCTRWFSTDCRDEDFLPSILLFLAEVVCIYSLVRHTSTLLTDQLVTPLREVGDWWRHRRIPTSRHSLAKG